MLNTEKRENVAGSYAYIGRLGPARSSGEYNFARVRWYGDYSTVLQVNVTGYDDLFRAKVVSRFFDDEGVMVRRLTNYQGQCQL